MPRSWSKDRPTLAIFGKRDTVVDWRESIEVYRSAFRKSGNRDLTIEVFDDADHEMLPSPDPSIVIRPATLADAEALARLGAQTFVETFGHLYAPDDLAAFLATSRSASAYAALISDPRTRVLLAASIDEPPVGYAVVGSCKLPVTDLEPKAGEVRELYVLAEFQKLKLGTRLLASALQWLNSQQHTPLYVGVWSENVGAQRLYSRFGFQKIGEYDFPVGGHLDREFIMKQVPTG